MLRRLSEMYGFKLHAADGSIGDVHDLFFDDARRIERSLAWVGQIAWLQQKVRMDLTHRQIRASPELDETRPGMAIRRC